MIALMAVTVSGFKQFASWPTPGTPSVGLVVMTRTDPADQTVIDIPKGTDFYLPTNAAHFRTLARAIMNESQTQIELLIQNTQNGARGNIAAGQRWGNAPYKPEGSRITGVTLSNPAAFSQGKDSLPGGITAKLMAQETDDQKVQNFLDVSTSQIRTMMGLNEDEDLPVAPRIDHAIYVWCLYLIEQNSSQRINKTMDIQGFIIERRSHFPRDGQLREAVEMKVLGLISPFRQTARFMTDDTTT